MCEVSPAFRFAQYDPLSTFFDGCLTETESRVPCLVLV